MEVKISIVMMSHLSDLYMLINDPRAFRIRVEFVKYLAITYDNIDAEIDADAVFETFRTKFPQFFTS